MHFKNITSTEPFHSQDRQLHITNCSYLSHQQNMNLNFSESNYCGSTSTTLRPQAFLTCHAYGQLNHWVEVLLHLLLALPWDYVRFWVNANSMRLMMAGSSLLSREVPSQLAIVTASERQLPSSSTPDEVHPTIARWKSLTSDNGPIRTGIGQKMVLYIYTDISRGISTMLGVRWSHALFALPFIAFILGSYQQYGITPIPLG